MHEVGRSRPRGLERRRVQTYALRSLGRLASPDWPRRRGQRAGAFPEGAQTYALLAVAWRTQSRDLRSTRASIREAAATARPTGRAARASSRPPASELRRSRPVSLFSECSSRLVGSREPSQAHVARKVLGWRSRSEPHSRLDALCSEHVVTDVLLGSRPVPNFPGRRAIAPIPMVARVISVLLRHRPPEQSRSTGGQLVDIAKTLLGNRHRPRVSRSSPAPAMRGVGRQARSPIGPMRCRSKARTLRNADPHEAHLQTALANGKRLDWWRVCAWCRIVMSPVLRQRPAKPTIGRRGFCFLGATKSHCAELRRISLARKFSSEARVMRRRPRSFRDCTFCSATSSYMTARETPSTRPASSTL